jgi:hypothetical protein
MRYLFTSNPLTSSDETHSDQIILIAQYYIDSNPVRAKEIKHCLHQNVDLFDKIILLNEREYSPEEMGFLHANPKIVQSFVGRRMRYEDAFNYARSLDTPAYIVIANSDIFFDNTLVNIRNSDLSEHKKCMAQLRIEYSPDRPPQLFGPRYDSQDAWIFHTNHLPPFPINVGLGVPGCDNKLAYLLHCGGFDVINHPDAVRTFHYHTSQVRRYTAKDVIPDPYACIIPYGVAHPCMDSLGIKSVYKDELTFDDDKILYDYILRKLNSGDNFVIPRIGGIETTEACFYYQLYLSGTKPAKEVADKMSKYIHNKQHAQVLKNNAGIWFKTDKSRENYSKQNFAAFQNCDLFCGWEKWGSVYAHVGASQEYIAAQFGKKMISSLVFDIFHYIHHENPWTHALRGKRVLIISAFSETMKKQVAIRENIYGRDLFPECTFLFLVPPQTQAGETAEDFTKVTDTFYGQIDALAGQYDVALVSCGGYGIPTVQHIYETGGSAIYVGGVLQMYFGILGNRWLKDRTDMVRVYLNKFWTRPAENEKPKGHQAVEGGCYW